MKAFIPIALLLPFVIAQTKPLSKCTIDRQGNLIAHHFSYTERNDDVKSISVNYIQGLGAPPSQTSRFGGAYAYLKVYIGPDEIFSQNLAVDNNGAIRKTMHWGPIFGGPKKATVDAVGDIMTNGTIDGRVFVVNNHTKLTFLDGKDLPLFKFPQKLRPTVSAFAGRMAKALRLCTASNTNTSVSTAIEPASLLMERQVGQDRGHFSDTYRDVPCVACKALWIAWWTSFEVACSASTCWFFGIGCAACTAATAVGLPASLYAKSASTRKAVVAPGINYHVPARRAAHLTRYVPQRGAVLDHVRAPAVAAQLARYVSRGGAVLAHVLAVASVVSARTMRALGADAAPPQTDAAANAAWRVTQPVPHHFGLVIALMLPGVSAVELARSKWAPQASAAYLDEDSVLIDVVAVRASLLGERVPTSDSLNETPVRMNYICGRLNKKYIKLWISVVLRLVAHFMGVLAGEQPEYDNNGVCNCKTTTVIQAEGG
ncbi:hypothetical protein TWF706_011563 [Orbilia oligospora]|uniref:Cellobiose dehydrogenase cytochrome domain-containing protein n=1 Tax=Orbilia oligospora TaxID=2813651 RepID=A0A7C8JR37_ORBOL|nr:hypothetical protein TWF706_011563 [Orbilia oligospora]KAF3140948.1 hypothetical protein TWF703_002453 [Orbilia oligospora]